MKKLLPLLAAAGLAFSFAAHAADAPAAGASAPAKAPTAQQGKMAACNTEAGDKKGDERKAFMKQCLSAKKATQQDKMKSCNADAKTKALKGDERKAFMKECLSNKPA
ncbi:MAG: phosphate starvation-inducible protein PsiF [Proteobacteria bacterium]|nr:phosphate starvation-inducible protein PsiF [Pseudomonadota bacterium]